jgi:hypothetical protein
MPLYKLSISFLDIEFSSKNHRKLRLHIKKIRNLAIKEEEEKRLQGGVQEEVKKGLVHEFLFSLFL